MNNNLQPVKFAMRILIVLHLISKTMELSLLKVLVSSTCGHITDNPNLLRVVGIFQCVVIHKGPHHILYSMEGRSNGSALQSKRMH